MSRATSPLRDRMIFVVGARRSGTNWLQRVVGAHPDILALPSETSLFSLGLAPLADRIHHGSASSGVTGTVYMDRERMLDALRDLCDTVFAGVREGMGSEAGRILERTPDHVRHLGLMGEVYPDGWFLHIVRDGRDVARSLVSQPWGPETIEEAAEEWTSAVTAARRSAPGLERYREVRYETLLDDPRREAQGIFAWLGLDDSTDIVEAALVEAGTRFNVDPAAPQIASEKWRHALDPVELDALERIAGPTLRDLGYVVAPAEASAIEPPPPTRRHRRPGLFRRGRSGRQGVSRGLLRDSNHLAHRLVDLLGRHRFDDLGELTRENVHVTIVDETTWSGRGRPALERLTTTLRADPALEGHQVRGDVHPSVPTTFMVLTFRTSDGAWHDRLLATTAEGGKISRIAYYRRALA